MTQLSDFNPLPIDENYKPIQGVYRSMDSGRKVVTTPATPVKLMTAQTQCKSLDVTAFYTNTDLVYVGGSGVLGIEGSEKGVPLAAGNTYTFKITDVSNVWLDAIVGGEGVSFNYFY